MWRQSSGNFRNNSISNTAWPFFTMMHLRYSWSYQNVIHRLQVHKLLCNTLPRVSYEQDIFDIFCNKGKSTNIKGKHELYITVYISALRTTGNVTNNTLWASLHPNTIIKQSIVHRTVEMLAKYDQDNKTITVHTQVKTILIHYTSELTKQRTQLTVRTCILLNIYCCLYVFSFIFIPFITRWICLSLYLYIYQFVLVSSLVLHC